MQNLRPIYLTDLSQEINETKKAILVEMNIHMFKYFHFRMFNVYNEGTLGYKKF